MIRLQTQLDPPPNDRGQDDRRGEISGQFVIAGCDAAPILEAAERAFDDVSSSVGGLIERMAFFPPRVLLDLRLGAAFPQEGPECIAVVGGVAEQHLRGGDLFDQPLGGR